MQINYTSAELKQRNDVISITLCNIRRRSFFSFGFHLKIEKEVSPHTANTLFHFTLISKWQNSCSLVKKLPSFECCTFSREFLCMALIEGRMHQRRLNLIQ